MSGSRRLRVAVMSSLPQDSGGYRRARAIANGLQAAGAEVVFVECTNSMPFMFNYFVSLILNLRVLWVRCDVVLAQKPLFNVAVPLLLKRVTGTPVVLDVDDIDWGFRTGPVSWINRLLVRPVPSRCDCVTYHTDRLRAVLCDTLRVPERRLFRLPQGVDLNVYRPQDVCAERPPLPSEFDGKPLMVHPAHLNVACELEPIFEIVARARRSRPDLRLLVVGGGPRERYFRRLASAFDVAAATWFTGRVPPAVVARYLNVATVGIVYLRNTPVNAVRQSMKLREMFAIGLPVVCNDAGELASFRAITYQTTSEPDAVAQELVRFLSTGGDGREAGGPPLVSALAWNAICEPLYEHMRSIV